MERLLSILGLFVIFVLLASCQPGHTIPSVPSPDIPIPEWIQSPKDIETWLISEGAKYGWDEDVTGYIEYYFTPAELLMSAIPDVNLPGRWIKKKPWVGDCDDFAIFTAYVMEEKLGYQAWYIEIQMMQMAHAISCAQDQGGLWHCFSLWVYYGPFSSMEDFLQRKFPGWRVRKRMRIDDFLNILFSQGHVRVFQSDSPVEVPGPALPVAGGKSQ